MIAPGPLTLAVSFSRNKPFHSIQHVDTNFVLKPQLGARKRKPDKTNVLLFLTTPAFPLLFCTMILLFLCSNVSNSFFHSPMSSLSLSSCFFFYYNYYCNKHLWNCAIRVSFVSLLWRIGWGVGLTEDITKGNKLGWVVLVHSLYFRCPSGFCTLFDAECRQTMQENYACISGIIGTFCW